MIRYLLDTNIVSEPAKPDPSEVVLSRLRERSGEVALPAIAGAEELTVVTENTSDFDPFTELDEGAEEQLHQERRDSDRTHT